MQKIIYRGDIYEVLAEDFHENRFSQQKFTFYKIKHPSTGVIWIDSIHCEEH